MNRLLRILVVHSIRELIRYKSFLLLVAVLIVADRALQAWMAVDRRALGIPHWRELSAGAASYVFLDLPDVLWRIATDFRSLLALAGLFLLKELISLWPSSDMRRMHRGERKGSGVLASLRVLRWWQVAWDASAVATLVAVTALWCGGWYGFARLLWLRDASAVWLVLWVGSLAAAAPIVMAGMSYSSKLAVISRGGFGEKLGLFYRLFLDWGVFWRSWVLFAIRIVIEGLFVAVIPAGALLTIDNFWLRILVASVFAAPAYSYVKMASFKFFLEVYRRYPRVHEEYRTYYEEFRL